MTNIRFSLLFFSLALLLLGACKSSQTVAESKPKSSNKAYSAAGSWEYEIFDLPEGDGRGVMTLTQSGSEYSGTIASDLGETALESLSMIDKTLSCSFSVQGYEVELSGDFDGDNFDGKISAAGYEFPMKATRQK